MTGIALPKIDKKIIDQKEEIVKNLSKISGFTDIERLGAGLGRR